jgi:hypothetical protein
MLKIKNSIGKEIRKNLSIRQYSSASCCKDTALVAALSCTSYLKLSLHTILMFIRCWLETYRCFLNNIAAYLQEKRKKTNINCLFVTLCIYIFFQGSPGGLPGSRGGFPGASQGSPGGFPGVSQGSPWCKGLKMSQEYLVGAMSPMTIIFFHEFIGFVKLFCGINENSDKLFQICTLG